MVHRVLGRLDLCRVASWRAGRFRIMVNYAVVGKIVSVVTPCVKDRDCRSIWSDLWTSSVSIIDPNPLSATVNSEITQSPWFKIVQSLFGNGVPKVEAAVHF